MSGTVRKRVIAVLQLGHLHGVLRGSDLQGNYLGVLPLNFGAEALELLLRLLLLSANFLLQVALLLLREGGSFLQLGVLATKILDRDLQPIDLPARLFELRTELVLIMYLFDLDVFH